MTKTLLINASSIHPTQKNAILASLYRFSILQAACLNPKKASELILNQDLQASYLTTFLHLRSNYYKYTSREMTALIQSYKLGRVNTREFLNQIRDLYFPHLLKITVSDELRNMIYENQALYLSLAHKDIPNPSKLDKDDICFALLEDAWGCRIAKYNDEYLARVAKIADLIKENGCDNITIVSNSNPIDMHRFIHHLKASCPEFKLNDTVKLTDSTEITSDNKMLTLGTLHGVPVHMAVSYRLNSFKTDEQSQGIHDRTLVTTQSIFSQLIETSEQAADKFCLLSHWKHDLDMGVRLNVPRDQIFKTEQLFPKKQQASHLTYLPGVLFGMLVANCTQSAMMNTFVLSVFTSSQLYSRFAGYQNIITRSVNGFSVGYALGVGGQMFFPSIKTTPFSKGVDGTRPAPRI